MPQLPLDRLRGALERGLAQLQGESNIVVFGCNEGADVTSLAAKDVASFSLICTGMLPPSFVEYALRGGAAGVLVTGCRGCAFRLGKRWTEERLSGVREPHLRGSLTDAVRIAWADRGDGLDLAATLMDFRQALTLERRNGMAPMPASTEMTAHV